MLFENVLSENEFIGDVDALLEGINKKELNETEKALLNRELSEPENTRTKISSFFTKNTLSFIAIDIDKQSSIATRYGDIAARNLIREVGWRIRGQLRSLSNLNHRRLYHMYADGDYLILDGMSLEEARDNAVRLKKALDGRYLVDAHDVSLRITSSPDVLLELPDVTVHLGMYAYL